MLFNEIYKDSSENSGFWSELNVNYEHIREMQSSQKSEDLQTLLIRLSLNSLKEIAILEGITSEFEKKNLYIEEIVKRTEKDKFFLLNSFSKRKKKSIDEFYSYKFNQSDAVYISSTLSKLLHILNFDRTDLFQILTLEEWNSKGSGYQLESEKKQIDWGILDNLKNSKESRGDFVDYLSEKSDKNQQYRIRTYSEVSSNEIIFMIYKLKNDLQKVDFDKSKRIKDVNKIFFKVNKTQNIIHVKCSSKKDMINIKSYFEDKLKEKINLYEEPVFTNYNPTDFKKVFQNTDRLYSPELKDFQIDKIVFSESLLNKSPEVTLYLPKQNIWLSVVDAVSMNLINIESISSVKLININYNNISRRITSNLLDDGSVVFKLTDNGLGAKFKEEIAKCFKLFFGIPLNRRINDKLDKGRADNIDLVLRLKNKDSLDSLQLDIFEDLCQNKIIKHIENTRYLCKNEYCRHEIDIKNSLECSNCGEFGYIEDTISSVDLVKKNILKYIKTTLSKGLDINEKSIKQNTIDINNLKFDLFKFNYKSRDYQIIITDMIIPKSITDKIQKSLVPTILVYYGVDTAQIRDMTPSTMEKIQFGSIYINKHDELGLKNIYELAITNVDKLIHHQIVTGATLANNNIRKVIIEDKDTNEQYTYNDLEDDAFLIIKDIFYNSDKWGRENIGKAVPEGVFAMSYLESVYESIERRYAFSYDCKLTAQEKGYDLGKSEQRKAEDYVTKLNSESAVKAYCSNKNISAHIFIGNKFRNGQIEGMIEHFESKMPRGCITKPMFITVENLLKLHDWYRLNYESIKININEFYEELYKAMINNSNIISDEILDDVFTQISQYFNRTALNTELIKNNLTK